jgi:hypothetical protein
MQDFSIALVLGLATSTLLVDAYRDAAEVGDKAW